MANPTTYFGWVMPTATDLVTDLPADFNTFGQGVDTSMQDLLGGTTGQILSKTSATNMDFTWISPNPGDVTGVTAGTGITVTDPTGPVPTVTNSMATAITTNGDLIYGTGSGTFTRRAIGATNDVLTVTGGIPTWAAPATPSSKKTYALLSTTTTNTGTSFTVTGLSGYDNLYVVFSDIRVTDAGNNETRIQINGSGTGSSQFGGSVAPSTTFTTITKRTDTATPFRLMSNGTVGGQDLCGYFYIQGANTAGIKMITQATILAPNGGTNAQGMIGTGVSTDTNVVSSLKIVTTGTAFNSGTMYIYGAA
jgi:hypothetical protein